MHVHFVYLFAPWTQGVNWVYNKTFRSRPECLRNSFVLSDCGLCQGPVHISSVDTSQVRYKSTLNK